MHMDLCLLVFIFLLKFLEDSSQHWKNIVLAGVFTGFSIMSKGPVAIYALLLPFLLSYGIVYKFKSVKLKIVPILTFISISLLIGGCWFVYVRYTDPEAFLTITTKEIGNWKSYNVRPFYYYWSFFTQSGIWTIPAFISLIYPYIIKRIRNKKAYRFTFFWTIFSVILLSLIQEKKARYLVPVLIPLALNTGFYINYLIKYFSKLSNKKEWIPVYFNFGLIGLIGISFPFVAYFLLKDVLTNYWINYLITSLILVSIGILIFFYLHRKNIKRVVYLAIALFASILVFGLPLSNSLKNNTNFNNINSLPKLEIDKNFKTYSVGTITPELLWEYGNIIENIKKETKLKLPVDDSFGLLIATNDVDAILKELSNEYKTELLEIYDLNVGKKSKERLISHLYLLSKK